MPAGRLIAGLRALGKALGVSHITAREYTLHAEWRFGKGPWKQSLLPAMRGWRDALPGRIQQNAGEREGARQKTLTDVKIEKGIADTQGKRLATAILAKKFHNAEECLRRRLNALHRHKEDLYDMVEGLPVDEPTRQIVRDRIEMLLSELSSYSAADKTA